MAMLQAHADGAERKSEPELRPTRRRGDDKQGSLL